MAPCSAPSRPRRSAPTAARLRAWTAPSHSAPTGQLRAGREGVRMNSRIGGDAMLSRSFRDLVRRGDSELAERTTATRTVAGYAAEPHNDVDAGFERRYPALISPLP